MTESWRETTLGAEINLLYGKSLAEPRRRLGSVPVYGSNGRVGWHNAALVDGPGVILGRKGSVGAVAFSETPFWPIDTTYYVTNEGGHDWLFLYYLLRYHRLDRLNSHTAVPGLNRESALSTAVVLPPHHEQTIIAGLLRQVERLVELEKRLIATIRELKQAAMEQLFTRGLRGEELRDTPVGELPASWEVVLLGTVGKIGNGSTPKRSDARYWRDGTIPWLTSGKIHERTIRRADEFVTDTAVSECHLPKVPVGSVLVAITGQGRTLGNVALTAIETCVSQHLAFVAVERDDVDANFLRHYLSSRYEYLRGLGSAGGSTKGALTCAVLKSVLVPRPVLLNEQQEIAGVLDSIDRTIAAHERKREVLAELFETLLHDLMTARVRVPEAATAVAAASV